VRRSSPFFKEIELLLRRITDDQRIPEKMMYEVDFIDFVHHFFGPIGDRLSRYEIDGKKGCGYSPAGPHPFFPQPFSIGWAVTEIAIR
jgi:hypothetical protein